MYPGDNQVPSLPQLWDAPTMGCLNYEMPQLGDAPTKGCPNYGRPGCSRAHVHHPVQFSGIKIFMDRRRSYQRGAEEELAVEPRGYWWSNFPPQIKVVHWPVLDCFEGLYCVVKSDLYFYQKVLFTWPNYKVINSASFNIHETNASENKIWTMCSRYIST